MNWKKILSGIGNAALNGAAGATAGTVYQWANSAAAGTPTNIDGTAVGFMAAGGAILGLLNYLMPSPNQPKPAESARRP